jgi:hypothetical protein
MLEPDFDPVLTAVQIGRCGYPAPCRAPRCAVGRATIVLRKFDTAGRPVRQIELCERHAVLDGELVVFDDDGRSNFSRLMNGRAGTHLYVFDLLLLARKDFRACRWRGVKSR